MLVTEKVVVVVGDLHVGGSTALTPPEYIGVDGNITQQNKVQEILWPWWKDATETWLPRVLRGRDHVLVLNGDLVEGCHHRTKQLMDVDEATHADGAVQVLSPLAAAASRTFVIRGTEAHVGSLREHSIGARLGSEIDPSTGKHAFFSLDLRVHGCLTNFAHHIGTSSREYLSAGRLSIAAGTRTLGRVWAGREPPKVWCSAHAHHFDAWTNGWAMTVCGPSWQFPTNYVHKVVPGAKPEVGIYVLDWDGCDEGDLPVLIPRLYRTSLGGEE